MQNAQFKNVNKRIQERKKSQRKRFKRGKAKGGKSYADFVESSEEEEGSGKEEQGANTDDESDGESPGNFYIKFKEHL